MGCVPNQCCKILFIIGGVFGGVAVILFIAGFATAAAGVSVGFEIEDAPSGTMELTGDSICGSGCTYHIEAEYSRHDECDSIYAGLSVTLNSVPETITKFCSASTSFPTVRAQWEIDNDPPLFEVGSVSFTDSDTGTVQFTSTITNIWVVDATEEIGEAVGGIVGGLLMYYVGVVIAIVGSILCCVGCCCMCTNDAPGGAPQGGTQIGRSA